MLRSQTLLVILIVLVLVSRGMGSADPVPPSTVVDAPTQTLDPDIAVAPTATIEVLPTATNAPTPEPTPTREPSGPIGFTSTPDPTQAPPTVEPTEAPPTPIPTAVSTERPAPPPVAEEDEHRSKIIIRGSSGRQEVAFTFDAGEGRGHTEAMLDLLAQYGIKATFGVTGQWAEQNPDLMMRMVEEGHQVINHTYNHSSFTGQSSDTLLLDDEGRRYSIEQTELIIEETTGGYTSIPYFRFPYGDRDEAALALLAEMGYSYTIWWTCDTWAWMNYSPDQIVERCGPSAELGGPGAILLFHVTQDGDMAALEPLLQEYLDAGYDFVTVEQMIQP